MMRSHIIKLPLYISTNKATKPSSYRFPSYFYTPSFPSRNIATSPQTFKIKLDPFSFTWAMLYKLVEDKADSALKDVVGERKDPYADGIQTSEELRKNLKMVIPWLREKDIDTILQQIDEPTYTFEEFANILKYVNDYKQTMDVIHDNVFNKSDKDRDGKLDVADVKHFVDDLFGLETRTQRKERVLDIMKADKDNDGYITRSDYEDYFWRDEKSDPFKNFVQFETLRVLPVFENALKKSLETKEP